MLYIMLDAIKLLTSKSSLGTQTEYPRVIPRFFKNQKVGDLEVKKSQILVRFFDFLTPSGLYGGRGGIPPPPPVKHPLDRSFEV